MSATSHPEHDLSMGAARWAGQVKAVIRALLGYFQIRSQLLALECREAATVGRRQLLVSLVAGTLLVVGYALLVVCLIKLLSTVFHIAWVWPAFVLGLLHVACGSVTWWFAQNRLNRPLFEATLAELEKDQEWITRNIPSQPERRN